MLLYRKRKNHFLFEKISSHNDETPKTISRLKLGKRPGEKRKKIRKGEALSLGKWNHPYDAKTLFFASFKASLTVEAAMVLPVFLFCMLAALQYCIVIEMAVKYGAALTETGKTLATSAYVTTYTGEWGEEADAVVTAITVAYANSSVMALAGESTAVKNVSMGESSILEEDQLIDLVLTYQIKTPFGMISLPGTLFVQRVSIRAWVGYTNEDDTGSDEEDSIYVYVTETGSVYHLDENCTYLKLSIQSVSADTVSTLRNNSGEIYHACELCGSESGSTVYITNEGNRYHSTTACSGLKRTVYQVLLSEVGEKRACSKCG